MLQQQKHDNSQVVKMALVAVASLALVAVAGTQNVNALNDAILVDTGINFVKTTDSQGESDLLEDVNSIMEQTADSLNSINFILYQYEDLSVSLYSYNGNEDTLVGIDDLPNKMTPIADYPNTLALLGANGAEDVLDKFVEYS